MAKKCARTFSIVVEKGKKSILDVRHLLPVGIARYVRDKNDDLAPPPNRGAGCPTPSCDHYDSPET